MTKENNKDMKAAILFEELAKVYSRILKKSKNYIEAGRKVLLQIIEKFNKGEPYYKDIKIFFALAK